jgi:hypothetical protein
MSRIRMFTPPNFRQPQQNPSGALRCAVISNDGGREARTRLLDTSHHVTSRHVTLASRRYWELLGGAVISLKVYEPGLPPLAQKRQ